ncbi:Manganese transport system membrane protein MntB [Phycisphaerae bacterium RAS1]|nr:Manganese transport system membrane protein MntB [Phycisphaerae bacterium RAS1]
MLALTWLPMDTWIVAVGAMSGMACALLGTFLLLRKMSMMGDAISHAVLPGLAAAFLITGSRGSATMLAGAAVVGVLTALLTQWIYSVGRVDRNAAMGVVFTVLFAIGLILIRRAADFVDLDPDCVLYGAIELIPLDTLRVAGWDVPRAAITIGGALGVNLLFVLLLYKELRITAFDPALATTLGINATLMHYLLMTLVAVTTVAAFESVGSILVIAMLIVPPAAAHLLTDRLSLMLLLALLFAAAAAALGHLLAIVAPGWFGMTGVSTNTAGMMGVVAGLLFVAAMLLGPRHGVLSKLAHRAALSVRIVREDVLGLLFRLEEDGRIAPPAALPALLRGVGVAPVVSRAALWSLRRAALVTTDGAALRLTSAGRSAAQQLVRSHRLWEAFLEKHLSLPPDHVHVSAERLEHVTGAALQTLLAESVGDPPVDPHGSPIPPTK